MPKSAVAGVACEYFSLLPLIAHPAVPVPYLHELVKVADAALGDLLQAIY